MIDYDDGDIRYWLHQVECVVRQMQKDWKDITVESVARELHDMYGGLSDLIESDLLLEICGDYMDRFSNPFDGLGDTEVDIDILTESRKKALFTAVTAKSNLLKEHAAKLDAYVKAKFGDNILSFPR